ncbi:MAG TPA: tetratricopeptide repeat protein [Gammaproteobacteria bacterium]
MMLFRLFSKVALLGYCLLCLNPLYAVDLGSFGERIFQFQEKLANDGNRLAQYKLGTLYEFGVSVPPDQEQARQWYQQSASQGYQPAIDRLTYLEVRQNGYDEKLHREWFERVLSQAEAYEADSLILLGQMNRHGIVVEKNINMAVNLLQQASSQGHTEVDSQIDELKREIYANQQRIKARQQQEAAKAKPVAPPRPKAAPAKVVEQPAEAEPTKDEMEARRRRYEEAMRELYKEELLLQQQQEWAESIPPVE